MTTVKSCSVSDIAVTRRLTGTGSRTTGAVRVRSKACCNAICADGHRERERERGVLQTCVVLCCARQTDRQTETLTDGGCCMALVRDRSR